MKKTLIIATIALAATAGMTLSATAQGTKADPANCPAAGCPAAAGMAGQGPGGGHMAMMAGLNLTDAQKAQVQDIMAQHREDAHTKIRAILTPEQQTAFDANKPGMMGGGRMMKDINLTDAQKTQVRDIMTQEREDTHAKIRAILTPEQQATFDANAQKQQAGGGQHHKHHKRL